MSLMRRNVLLVGLALLAMLPICAGCVAVPPAPAAPVVPTTPTSTSTGSGTTVNVAGAAPQPCCPKQTLWDFLGVKQGIALIRGLGGRILNRLGTRFPGLEARPPLLSIADPANLDSPNPAVAAAAGAKADEDAAPQKIKAIAYLGTLGCGGCYPDVQDALLAALDDCTESVRYAAVKALRGLAGQPCATCKTKSCCSQKVIDKLEKVANGTDDNGCYKEPSGRVRRMARLAIAGCGGSPGSPAVTEEGPTDPADGEPAPGAETTARAPARGGAIARPDSRIIRRAANPPADNRVATRTIQPPQTVAGAERVTAGGIQKAYGSPIPRTIASPPAKQPPPAGGTRLTSGVEQTGLVVPLPAVGQVVARVNDEPIYEEDIQADLEQEMAQQEHGLPQVQVTALRHAMFRKQLQSTVNRKLMCQEARRVWRISGQAHDEKRLADDWLRQNLQVSQDVSRQEIVDFYQQHLSQYGRPTEVRWQLIAAPWNRFASRSDALAALEEIRGEALGGNQSAPPSAQRRNLEFGNLQWTKPDLLPPGLLTQTLRDLGAGKCGPIWEEGQRFVIVRMAERRQNTAMPLESVSDAIRQEILRQRRASLEEAHLERLRRQARVWTVFDTAAAPVVTRP
jgi:hypothetical protein